MRTESRIQNLVVLQRCLKENHLYVLEYEPQDVCAINCGTIVDTEIECAYHRSVVISGRAVENSRFNPQIFLDLSKLTPMWLLNTTTLGLEFFQDDRGLEYAILSHRWQDDEVLFRDVQSGDIESKAGFKKLKQTCEKAKQAGYQYVWQDTCAIDKSSSAELSEAINSMFRWYQCSGVCFAYMFDVGGESGGRFEDSVWFTRGWTLQELIAPRHIEFYDCDWQLLGTRKTLQRDIATVTGIPEAVLAGKADIEEYSIAQRMSWAAKRVTTRVEDMAYSLLGIFNVNMPMLYGEGEKAFIRLQEAIMVDSPDDSIFAWRLQPDLHFHGLLARSPAGFVDCGSIEMAAQPRSGFHKTNLGIRFTATVHHYAVDVYHVELECTRKLPSGEHEGIGIFAGYPFKTRSGGGIVARRIVQASDPLSHAPFPPTNGSKESTFLRALNFPMRPFINRTVEPRFNGIVLQKFKLTRRGEDITNCAHIIARPNTCDESRPDAVRLPFGANGWVVGIAICEQHALGPKHPEQASGTMSEDGLSALDDNPMDMMFGDIIPPSERGGTWMIAKLGFDHDWNPVAWVADMLKIPSPDPGDPPTRVLTNASLRDISNLAKATKELSVDESFGDVVSLTRSNHFTGSRVDGMDIKNGRMKIRAWREMRPELGGWAWIAELEIKVSSFGRSIQWPSSEASIVAESMRKQRERQLATR